MTRTANKTRERERKGAVEMKAIPKNLHSRDFVAVVEQASCAFDLPRPPLALIGVGTLFEEGIRIEAEVTAVIDRVDPLPNAYGGA